MCGIFFSVCNDVENKSSSYRRFEDSFIRRGPDQHGIVQRKVNQLHLLLASWVLHMRGLQLAKQPAKSESGSVLLWNGEVYGGMEVAKGTSDTDILLQKLTSSATDDAVTNTMSSIEGPWSFAFFQQTTNKLWFGRDYFGRRSLLFWQTANQFVVSSVAKRPTELTEKWMELPAALYCIDLKSLKLDNIFDCIKTFPWVSITNGHPKVISLDKKVCELGCHIHSAISSKYSTYKAKQSNLYDSEKTKTFHTTTSLTPIEQLRQACDDKNLWPVCKNLNEKLSKAVQRRTKTMESWGIDCKVGVLFSGGIDCTMLALLAHSHVPINETIDLLNVAFECRKSKPQKQNKNIPSQTDYSVPDRCTGGSSYKELCDLCPERKWNFVEINVTLEELQNQRLKRIADLTYPKDTVLDDSIACALWFASSGKGFIKMEDGTERPYTSTARKLLCGMGADEQLGGYSRHRSAYEKSMNWSGVSDEIEMEIERISERNLGRDDRILSDHGREAQFPYLDEEVVAFLSHLPVYEKADFRMPRGVGEKILLRAAAYLLGLRGCAVLPKRAIQFGSRIAKAESAAEKGNQMCSRLKTLS